ncbi:uncharacterized protein PAC_16657 [Phialocephala subalpina]|uniref:BTB domain-containing protein n=1 Tax=Phialocephala subalpina TaxID=576137 RepID=A0A1L7XP99_9HELO|nr:uncharacterized protein PAC_16657 [Phialocephala subalpina]
MNSLAQPSKGESSASGAARESSSSFLSSLGSDIVVLNIGTAPSIFQVKIHPGVLGEKSTVFLQLLNLEDGTKPTELNFLDENPTIFGHMLEYIYKGRVISKGEPLIKTEELTETNLARAALDPSPLVNGNNKRQVTITFKNLSGENNSGIVKFKVLLQPYAKQVSRDAEAWTTQVEKDIDFGVIKQKLKDDQYTELSEIDQDFDLLYSNHVQVHGPGHNYTKLAFELKGLFHQKTAEMRKGTVSDKNLPGLIPNPPTLLQQQHTKMAQLRIPLPSDELLALHILATKYQVSGLQDLSMTSLISSHIQSRSFPTLTEIILSFSAVPTDSPLRRYLVKTVCYNLMARVDKPNDLPDTLGSTDNLYQLCTESEELGKAVFQMLRGRNGASIGDPRCGGFCEFHAHGRQEVCSLGGVNGRKRRAEDDAERFGFGGF